MTTILTNDGKYEPYEYRNEDELEKIVIEHAKEIFGEDCLFFPKKLIQNRFNIKTIPDGFLVDVKNKRFYIVEVERNEHDFYGHIQPQISKFRSSFREEKTKREITEFIYSGLNDKNKEKIKSLAKNNDSYKFLHDIVFDSYGIIIVIDHKDGQIEEELEENFGNVKIIELKTYKKIGDEANHIHLFSKFSESEWGKTVSNQRIISEKHIMYKNFFDRVYDYIKEKGYDFKTNKGLDGYKQFFVGKNGMHFEVSVSRNSIVYIRFDIELNDRNNTDKIFDFLESRKDIITKDIGDVEFERNWGTKWARVIKKLEFVELNDEAVKKSSEELIKFIKTIKPILDEFLKNNSIESSEDFLENPELDDEDKKTLSELIKGIENIGGNIKINATKGWIACKIGKDRFAAIAHNKIDKTQLINPNNRIEVFIFPINEDLKRWVKDSPREWSKVGGIWTKYFAFNSFEDIDYALSLIKQSYDEFNRRIKENPDS